MTGIITSIIISIILGIGQASCPEGFEPYVITHVDANEKYDTVYGINAFGEYRCILDDVTPDWEEEWMVTIGQLVYVNLTDGYVSEVINLEQYTPYTVTEVVENQIPGFNPYYTVYAQSPTGEVECILDDETAEWLDRIGHTVYVKIEDGYTVDIR